MKNRRSTSYPGAGGSVFIPSAAWESTVAELRCYGMRQSEGLVFWGGAVTGSHLQVTGVYLIRHDPQGGTVRVKAAESRWLLRRLRGRDEKLLAQVHSHPREAFHSHGDDAFATSYHPGFLSIVIPHFARRSTQLAECAVYEFRNGTFVRLEPGEVRERVRVCDLVMSRRPPFMEKEDDHGEHTPKEEKSGWISSLVSNLRRKFTVRPRR